MSDAVGTVNTLQHSTFLNAARVISQYTRFIESYCRKLNDRQEGHTDIGRTCAALHLSVSPVTLLLKRAVISALPKPSQRNPHETDSIGALSFFTASHRRLRAGEFTLTISYLEAINAISERQSRVAVAGLTVAQSTQLASLQAARFFTQLALSSPSFGVRLITQLAIVVPFELVKQQVVLAKELTDIFVQPPRKAAPVAPNAPLGTTADAAEEADAHQPIADTANGLAMAADDAVQAARKAIDEDDQMVASTAEDAAPRLVTMADEDQEIELRAEQLVINKQRVQQGEARVRKEIVTEMKSFDVPVSHEELVIERHATGEVDVDSEPFAVETIRIPLTEEQVNITKQTVVREEVEIGTRRIEEVEHISDSVRHEELRVDDATINPATPRVNAETLVTIDDVAPELVTTADDAAPVATADDAAPEFVPTTDQDQEIELRAERLVVNKQRVPNGKAARVRKEIVTEKKSIDVPVSHEELVIDRQAVTGDVDVDSTPLADETIGIPLTEEQVNIAKETVVAEEVEIGTRRVEDVEHISDTVRHEELRVDDAPTNHQYEPAV